MSKKIICQSCGAEFAEKLPKCPYCATLNIKGAEAEYLGKLQGVKEDMHRLTELPGQEQKKELKKQIKFWGIAALAVAIIVVLLQLLFYWKDREYDTYMDDRREALIWLSQHAEQLNALYEQEDYQALIAYLVEWEEQDTGLTVWEHWNFLCVCQSITWAKDILSQEAAGMELSLEDCQDLFFSEWVLKGIAYREDMTETEKEKLLRYGAELLQDYDRRFQLGEEENKSIEGMIQKTGGYVPADKLNAVVKDWYERQSGKDNQEK